MCVEKSNIALIDTIQDSKDHRIDIDQTSIRHFRVGSMSHRRRCGVRSYMGYAWFDLYTFFCVSFFIMAVLPVLLNLCDILPICRDHFVYAPYSYTCTLGMGLSVWRLCRCLWRRGLYLWQPAVPPVDVGSLHLQHLSVFVFIPCEYWSSLFRLMLLRNNVHWGRGCRCDDLLSLVARRVVFVTACGATGRCGVVTLTAPPCSKCLYHPTNIHAEFSTSTRYLSSLALRPNGRHFW